MGAGVVAAVFAGTAALLCSNVVEAGSAAKLLFRDLKVDGKGGSGDRT